MACRCSSVSLLRIEGFEDGAFIADFRTPQVDDNSGVAGGKTWGKSAVSCEELSSVISRVGVISRFPRRASICRRHAFTPVFVGVMAVIALGPWELERSY
jgi:hypothetical protein